MAGWETVRFDDLESFPVGDDGLQWHPIRMRLGIGAFGMNAYTSEHVGGEVVEDHTEETYGHEEAYIVVSGHATFTLGGEELDAPAGTIVFISDPTVRRSAVALEEGTRVLAVGGKRGEAFEPSAWELFFRAKHFPPEEALALIEAADGYKVDELGYRYNLAVARVRAGRRAEAVEAFRQAYELDPERVAGHAATDARLDPIRDEVSAITG